MTVIGIHAPTEGKDENDFFYKFLQQILEKNIKPDMAAIMGDFNIRVGKDKIYTNVGSNGETTCNRNAKKLIDFILYDDLKIMNGLL